MAIVTISGQFGSGALLLGDKLCAKTGFHMVDENIIHEVLRKEQIQTNWIDALEKEAASNALFLLSSIVSKGLFYSPLGPSDDEEAERKKYIKILKHIMNEMANKGGFVIIRLGAQFILKDHPRAIHILLVSEYEERIKLVAETLKISPAEARRMIKAKEKQDANMASNLFHEKIEDTSHYHMVINISKMSLEWAADMVLCMLEKQVMKEEVLK